MGKSNVEQIDADTFEVTDFEKRMTEYGEKLVELKRMSAKECNSIELQNTYKYGTEFLTAYIVWVANKKQIEDFSSFPDELIWDDKLVEIIKNEFAKAVIACFKREEIDSNLFKKDKSYLELRDYLSKLSVLDATIQKLFSEN